MPKLEPKQIQKDLEKGVLWPVYWLYGNERMISRELLKRIRKAVLGEQGSGGMSSFAEDILEGTEVNAAQVMDSALSLSLGGGIRFVVVRDAHAIRDADELRPLLGQSAPRDQIQSVCVFLSKDLDGRKKFSKALIESAAVVPCEEIAEEDREAWIGYLAKRRGLALGPEETLSLRALDPWNLDIVDQELEKASLAGDDMKTVLLGDASSLGVGAEFFLQAFFTRDAKKALALVSSFADKPDESLPLLGLLAWNVRHLALLINEQSRSVARSVKLSPYVVDRLKRWTKHWTLADITALQAALAEIDFGIKQTPRLPIGLWTNLVISFCGRNQKSGSGSSS